MIVTLIEPHLDKGEVNVIEFCLACRRGNHVECSLVLRDDKGESIASCSCDHGLGRRPWNVNSYAQVTIPKDDANEIREAIEKILLGDSTSLTPKQKELLTKLRARLEHSRPVSEVGGPKW